MVMDTGPVNSEIRKSMLLLASEQGGGPDLALGFFNDTSRRRRSNCGRVLCPADNAKAVFNESAVS